MVIVVQGAPRKRSAWGALGNALGEGLSSGLASAEKKQAEDRQFSRENTSRMMQNLERQEQAYLQRQQLEQGLEQVEQLLSDPNLSPQRKQLGLFKALSGSPEIAKYLSSQLQQTNEAEDERSYFNQIFGNQNQESTTNMTPSIFDDEEKGQTRGVQFDYNDPSKWTDKQIDNLRSTDSKSSRARTLANRAQNEYDRRQESKKAQTKYRENVFPLESAIDTLDRMEEIGRKGNLGIGSKYKGIISSQTRKDRSEYERLGKSLIQFSSNIPIRNRQEFETLAHDLYDPSISDASREGILSAMRRIIENSMSQYETPEGLGQEIDLGIVKVPTEEGVQRSSSKDRPSLTSFLR